MPASMIRQGMYAARPALFQLFILLAFMLAGAILSSGAGMSLFYLLYGFSATPLSHPDGLRLLQLLSALGTFLFPALGTAWLCGASVGGFLSVRRLSDPRAWLLTLLSLFLLSPLITWTGEWNQSLQFPEFLAPVERWMRMRETEAERFAALLIGRDPSPVTLLFNLVVVAAAAGLTEEFLFRGALERVIGGWTANHHLVIWIAAGIFSAFHFQFFGFVPRLLLGAYFGYLLYWGRSIWLPVFAHFINNALAVVGMSDSRLADNELVSGKIPEEHWLSFTLLALACTLIFGFVAGYLRKLLLASRSQG